MEMDKGVNCTEVVKFFIKKNKAARGLYFQDTIRAP